MNGEYAPHGRRVGMNYTLGQARRTRRVHDVEHVVVFGAALGFYDTRRGTVGVVGGCKGLTGVVRGSTQHMQPLVDVRFIAAALKVGHSRCEVVIEDQGLHARVFQNEFKFVCDQAPVERNNHAAHFANSEERFHELNRVHQQ